MTRKLVATARKGVWFDDKKAECVIGWLDQLLRYTIPEVDIVAMRLIITLAKQYGALATRVKYYGMAESLREAEREAETLP